MELPRLREWRHRRALTQRELAARARVGYTTINRLEQGWQKAHPGTARRIADALDVLPEDLQSPDRLLGPLEPMGSVEAPQISTQLKGPDSVYQTKSGAEFQASDANLDHMLSARFRLVQEAPGVLYLVEINDEMATEHED